MNYIESVYEYNNDTKYYKYNKNHLVNYAACMFFPKHLESQVSTNHYIDTIMIYSFLEHKQCMGWRINYIAQKENLENIDYKNYENYSRKMFEIVLNMSIKYNIAKEEKVLKQIVAYLNDINALELKVLKKLIKEI